MLRKVYWLIALCVIVGGLWAYGSYFSPNYRFRYQLTVDVDTPDGVKSGFSVIEATYWRDGSIDSIFGPHFPSGITGEAVFVDLGAGRNVVLTLTTFQSASAEATTPDYLPVKLYDLPWGDPDAYGAMQIAIERTMRAGPKAVPFEMLPLMITFRDVADPVSFGPVDPQHISRIFGPGYALKAVTIRPTDSPISEQLDKILPWLPGLGNKGLDGGRFTQTMHPFMIGAHDIKARGE